MIFHCSHCWIIKWANQCRKSYTNQKKLVTPCYWPVELRIRKGDTILEIKYSPYVLINNNWLEDDDWQILCGICNEEHGSVFSLRILLNTEKQHITHKWTVALWWAALFWNIGSQKILRFGLIIHSQDNGITGFGNIFSISHWCSKSPTGHAACN